MQDLQAAIAAVDLPQLMANYGIKLRKAGNGHQCCCVSRQHDDANPSMSVWRPEDKYVAYCHSCGWTGDAADVIAEVEGITQADARVRLLKANGSGYQPHGNWTPAPIAPEPALPRKEAWITQLPPADKQRPESWALGPRSGGAEFVQAWTYRDTAGAIVGYVARYARPDGGKEYRPWTYGKEAEALSTCEWRQRTWPAPRPLYGAELLPLRPDARVVIVEGEKAADAGRQLLPDDIVLTWPGGTGGARHADWQLLAGRTIVIVPDADDAGEQCAKELCKLLLVAGAWEVWYCPTDDQPAKWDLANALADGWLPAQTAEWIAGRLLKGGAVDSYAYQRSRPTGKEKGETMPATLADGTIGAVPARQATVHFSEAVPESLSDGNFAWSWIEAHGKDWKYTPTWGKWHHWSGTHWEHDERGIIKHSIMSFLHHAMATWPEARALSGNARRGYCSKRTRDSVYAVIANHPAVTVSWSIWDSDPWILATQGGVVDLRTGKLRDADQSILSTRCAAAVPAPAYDPSQAPHWEMMVAQVAQGDAGVASYIKRWCGHLATGDTSEEGFLFFYGVGQSGKSKFLNAISGALGSYAQVAEIEQFLQRDGAQHDEVWARLAGARMIVTSEPSAGVTWNEGKLKKLTGREGISCSYKFGSVFQYEPQFKLALSGNNRPALRSVGSDMRRRIHMVEFTKPVPDSKKIHDMPDKLRAEYPQILRWIIDGAVEWQKHGLKRPDIVMNAVTAYLEDEDQVGQWIEDCCEKVEGHRETNADLLRAYNGWAKTNHDPELSAKQLANKLDARGLRRFKAGGLRGFIGLRIKQTPANEYDGYADRF